MCSRFFLPKDLVIRTVQCFSCREEWGRINRQDRRKGEGKRGEPTIFVIHAMTSTTIERLRELNLNFKSRALG